MASETGTIWVCGAATKGLFVSCPIPKRVKSISAAGRRVAVTLDDGNVLAVELASMDNSGKEEGKGPETDHRHALAAVPWSRVAYHKTAQTCISAGSFGLLLSSEGEVYSWGDSNKWGELGLGGQFPQGTCNENHSILNADVSKVSGSIYGKNIVKISAGTTHAAAVGESGTLYTWGRGFEGQTGTTNLGVVLSPKLVKFSSEIPISTVSCGHNFTICVTRQGGQLYAFGEGGCGQLGIGKCIKFSEKPIKCSALGIKRGGPRKGGGGGGGNSVPPSSGSKHTSSGGGGAFPAFVDVSCGWAHAIARNERNEVYVWGLNAHGQLGLGHTDSIHLPMLLKDPYADQESSKQSDATGPTSAFNDTGTEYTLASSTSEATRPPLHLKDISAYGLATAGVRADGRVLTWGSGKANRLGHGSGEHSVFEPKLVDYIAGQKISMVHLGSDEMIAFAPTTLVKLEPTAGPIQGNSRFSIVGSGLWGSDKIVVKFEPIPSETLERMYPKVDFEPFTRARSTIGKFHYDHSTGLQSISCRTPNLADTQKALKKYLASANFEMDKKAAMANGSGGTTSKTNNSDNVDPLTLLQPPHPQPMTISVSMNGVDFVPVGEPHHENAKHSKIGDTSKSLTSGNRSNLDLGGGRGKRGPVVELRSHGIGPELKHRALYNFYSMASFQLTSVHPRLLTLPPSSCSSQSNRSLDPPVYLYIGGIGLYETSSISVRLSAPGKKAIVCNTADVVFLRKEDGGTGGMSSAAAAAALGDSLDLGESMLSGGEGDLEPAAEEAMDGDEGSSDVPATGLYIRLKVNDAIRELDESGRLPFETSGIAVALNGQDFVSLQGHRDENSVMFYRARLDSYTPSVVPAIAPPDTKDADTSYGVPVTVKGSGFFRVANRASCNGNIWHLRLRLTEPLPKSKEDNLNASAAMASSSGALGNSFDQTGSDNAMAVARRRKKLGPDVLVPCRYEDVNTLTALLPPFPLRSSYLSSSNKRRKPKGSVEKWPKPWPSLSCFHVDVVMANDDAKLLKLWEHKLNSGIEAPSVTASTILNNSSGEQVALTTEEVALSASDHLTVYSLPGMGPHGQGIPSFTLSIASGQFGVGKMIELVTIDPNYNLFSTSKCLVRFAFTNKEGSRFVRDGGKKANTKSPQLVVAQAEAALLTAQNVPEIEEDNLEEDDEEMLEFKAEQRQARLDKIEECEVELEAAQKSLEIELANSAAAESSQDENAWFVDIPAVVEQLTYSPEVSKVTIDRPGRKPSNPPKKRWVVRCRAPGLKMKVGGATEFNLPSQSLEQCNHNIMNMIGAGNGKNGGRNKKRKSKKASDKKGQSEQKLTSMVAETCFGEPNRNGWLNMNKEAYARVFVSLNGIHFHDWPANAVTNGEPVMPYDDKNNTTTTDQKNANPTGPTDNSPAEAAPTIEPVQRIPNTTVFNFTFEAPVVTSIDTPKGLRPGKDMFFNGRNFDVIPGVSKVKFTTLVPIPATELNGNNSDDDDDSDTSSVKSAVSATPSTVTRRKSLAKSFQNGPCAIVSCQINKKQQVVCEIPMMGDDVSPMRVELFLDGMKIMEIPSEDHFRSQVPYPNKATYTTIDLQYAGNSAPEPEAPPEPEIDPSEELHKDSDLEDEEDGGGSDTGGAEGEEQAILE